MKVFIACPIGSEDSSERVRSDKLLKYVINPAVKEAFNIEADSIIRADQMSEPGRITTQVLRELVNADVVIADVTDVNPNVMYEVGIRQAVMRPLILMAEKGQKLPFDLTDLRTIFYTLDLDHFQQAQVELTAQLQKGTIDAVSAIDKALFSSVRNLQETNQDNQSSQDMLAVMEVCESILRDTQETKELLMAVGNLTVEIREKAAVQEKAEQEKASQEMGKWMMAQLFQNPDGAAKVMPVIQAMADFGNATEQAKTEVAQTAPVPNRATRRRQQKTDKTL